MRPQKADPLHEPYVWFVKATYGKQCDSYLRGCPKCKVWKSFLACKSKREIESYLKRLLMELI